MYQSNPCCGCMITEDLKEILWKMKDTVDCCSCIIGSLWFWITYAKYESQSVKKGHNGLKSFLKNHSTKEYFKVVFVSSHYWCIEYPEISGGTKFQKKMWRIHGFVFWCLATCGLPGQQWFFFFNLANWSKISVLSKYIVMIKTNTNLEFLYFELLCLL